MHAFIEAVQAEDLEAVKAMLAEDVTFLSPVAFQPYEGREMVASILRGVLRVFGELDYVREIVDPATGDSALMFKTQVDGREVHGCDFLTFDDAGLIKEFTVMVRPLSAATALAEAMAAQFDQIKREVIAAQRD